MTADMDEKNASVAVRDPDGFAAIGSYAVLGDGRGVALVAADGSVDWWAAPRLDSTPPFAALLDPVRGGSLTLRPTDENATCERRYLPHTNLTESIWSTSSGRVRVTDSLNSGTAGALPWSELARRVEGLEGEVELELLVRPGDGLRAWEPWVQDDARGPILHAGTLTMGLRHSSQIRPRVSHDRVEAVFRVAKGERRVIGVVAADADPLFMCKIDAIDNRIDVSADSWREWSSRVRWAGAGREQVVRSALALKTLMIAETGAVAAAVTTSLPESIGGPKNWDYRFSWIRDAALTIDAMAALGLEEEVHAAVAWLLHAIRANGPDVHVMYTLSGHEPDGVRTPDLPGYRHSLPVQIGNSAAGQTQLGIYGDLFGTVADWVFGGHVLDIRSARELADLADRCADVWRHDDAGIWELHTDRPYTSSKMNCWRALDAAARLAAAGHLAGPGDRWRQEAAVIKAWVQTHCWSEQKQAYTFYAGSDDLDVSVLLGAQMGFDRGPRMSSTIDALSAELSAGPLLYRYTGVHSEEETFTACAFWRVHALVNVGRVEEAEGLLSELAIVAGPLGLMSEMCVPGTNEQMGNLPQALSHLSHIQCIAALRAAQAAP
ncbi:glycoside hydrolase family 15 protein [Allobranchiibius sp. GilTou73]|uniref:glycoside hydrolase family 15 protein n=1 Tax=Allobranchiibius sp. GilTou73 TaxID=2904523 RepID=UPI001F46827F|nr:glycoside hydrolase family 15 protein [Allobranchiibius sp. GilTou73]UIJ34316.1 glycoside hydrolase family 15 protein [Allobranchiibius sp. GilTou73]